MPSQPFHVHVPTEEELEKLMAQHQEAAQAYAQAQHDFDHYETVEQGWNIWSDAHYDALIQMRHAKAVALWVGRKLLRGQTVLKMFKANMLS